jgi:hypothetical protein
MLPSTLMLGATAHLSTDVASIPLLWVVPLALYLGSFVLAFARTSRKVPLTATKIAVALALLELVVTFSGPLLPIWLSLSTSLLMLATVAYAAHSRLAVDRPAPEHLTTYYMVIASGGALGGLLNGFVAPAVFSSVLEYPLALGAVPLLLVGARSGGRLRQYLAGNLIRVTIVVLLVVCVVPGVRILLVLRSGDLRLAIVLLAVVLLTGWLLTQNAALALVAVLALALTNVLVANHGVLDRSRTFYGSYRVVGDAGLHTFFHGTTVHGTQFGDPRRRDVPTTYYSRSGPLGDVFSVLDAHGLETVGAVGLGAGTLATYGRPGQRFTFFEIDPGVVRIAEDPRFFTYLRDSAASIRTVTGDGRLSLEKEPPASYDLLVLDAFSSDSIPVHLLTQEAIRMYASRLTPDGVLAFHVTNRLFDLQPVLHAAASSTGWTALVRTDDTPVAGATHSTWVLLGRDGAAVRALAGRPHWRPLAGAGVTRTDDYSSLLSVLR